MRYLTAVAVVSAVCAQGCATSLPRGPVPIEVWSGDDTGLGTSFRDALEAAFEASPRFKPGHGKRPGTVVIETGAVQAWEVGGRLRACYLVRLKDPSDRVLSMKTGTCWGDELPKCAEQVVQAATKTVRRRHGS
jgi:hypothetical protein